MNAMSRRMKEYGYRVESARLNSAIPAGDMRTRYESFPPRTHNGQWMTIGYRGSLSVQGVGYTERASLSDAIQQMKQLVEGSQTQRLPAAGAFPPEVVTP
jgi:hypothetical protein